MTIEELGKKTLEMFRWPDAGSVSEWADAKRMIVPKGNPEPGPWRTARAPYQREIMDAFSQKGIHDIAVMSAAQVGKTDMTLNMIGYVIDTHPGPALMVLPAEDDTLYFSKERLSPTIEMTPCLNEKVYGGNGSTNLLKNFSGGFLALTGAMSPGGLKSRPVRYLFMDEVDGYPPSAGTEGDPVSLAVKRTQNFFDAKRVYTSTPTVKGVSRIYRLFKNGTREEWEIRCKHCGAFRQVVFDDIRFEKSLISDEDGNAEFEVWNIRWRCPICQGEMQEYEVKRADGRWVMHNPVALEKGFRSFHINAFHSPWARWTDICKRFLDGNREEEMLKTFYNLDLGLPFERSAVGDALPEAVFARRERYDAEVPDGALVITLGIDTQDNRLEYEARAWGREEQSWGLRYGVIPGRPDEAETWRQLDELLDYEWKLGNGKTLKALVSFMDAGGHFYDDVMRECAKRRAKRLYPIRGDNKDTGPLVRHTRSKRTNANLFMLNVMVGKRAILGNLNVTEPGPRYMHFPDDPDAGYTEYYFKGLMSEQIRLTRKKNAYVEEWVKVYERNEPLDVCNYARCAFKAFRIDLDAYERRLYGDDETETARPKRKSGGLISKGITV